MKLGWTYTPAFVSIPPKKRQRGDGRNNEQVKRHLALKSCNMMDDKLKFEEWIFLVKMFYSQKNFEKIAREQNCELYKENNCYVTISLTTKERVTVFMYVIWKVFNANTWIRENWSNFDGKFDLQHANTKLFRLKSDN